MGLSRCRKRTHISKDPDGLPSLALNKPGCQHTRHLLRALDRTGLQQTRVHTQEKAAACKAPHHTRALPRIAGRSRSTSQRRKCFGLVPFKLQFTALTSCDSSNYRFKDFWATQEPPCPGPRLPPTHRTGWHVMPRSLLRPRASSSCPYSASGAPHPALPPIWQLPSQASSQFCAGGKGQGKPFHQAPRSEVPEGYPELLEGAKARQLLHTGTPKGHWGQRGRCQLAACGTGSPAGG